MAKQRWTPAEIKALRRAYGMRQEEFAGLCRVSIQALRIWEQGKGQPSGPATYVLDHLAENKPELQSA